MSDKLKRLKNVWALDNGCLRFSIETESEDIDVECTGADVTEIIRFLLEACISLNKPTVDFIVPLPVQGVGIPVEKNDGSALAVTIEGGLTLCLSSPGLLSDLYDFLQKQLGPASH